LVKIAENWENMERCIQYLEHRAKIGSYQLKKTIEDVEIKGRVSKLATSRGSRTPKTWSSSKLSSAKLKVSSKSQEAS
jgi:hypothetical protein